MGQSCGHCSNQSSITPIEVVVNGKKKGENIQDQINTNIDRKYGNQGFSNNNNTEDRIPQRMGDLGKNNPVFPPIESGRKVNNGTPLKIGQLLKNKKEVEKDIDTKISDKVSNEKVPIESDKCYVKDLKGIKQETKEQNKEIFSTQDWNQKPSSEKVHFAKHNEIKKDPSFVMNESKDNMRDIGIDLKTNDKNQQNLNSLSQTSIAGFFARSNDRESSKAKMGISIRQPEIIILPPKNGYGTAKNLSKGSASRLGTLNKLVFRCSSDNRIEDSLIFGKNPNKNIPVQKLTNGDQSSFQSDSIKMDQDQRRPIMQILELGATPPNDQSKNDNVAFLGPNINKKGLSDRKQLETSVKEDQETKKLDRGLFSFFLDAYGSSLNRPTYPSSLSNRLPTPSFDAPKIQTNQTPKNENTSRVLYNQSSRKKVTLEKRNRPSFSHALQTNGYKSEIDLQAIDNKSFIYEPYSNINNDPLKQLEELSTKNTKGNNK